MNSLEDLLSRRLLIQSGKGGTGKTTVSAALALLQARRGKRVLLLEVDTHDRFASLFGRSEPVGYEAVEVAPGVFAQNLDPQLVIVDFFKVHLRFKAIYGQIVDSKLFHYFYAAAPGVRELICIGKVWRLLQAQRRGRPAWDAVILDAPATGHGLAILNIAQAAFDTLLGPMRAHAREIRDMLRDPATTALNLCAIPEEMPVNEASDLYQAVTEELEIPLGFSFMSRVASDPVPAAQREAVRAALREGGRLASALGGGGASALRRGMELCEARAALSARYTRRLAEQVPLPVVPIPRLDVATFDRSALDEIAEAIVRGAPVPASAAGGVA